MNAADTIQQVGSSVLEGYVGIRAGEEQVVSDVIFASILFLFVFFSIAHRSNLSLSLKMMQDLFFVKERQSLFLLSSNNELFFRNYMTFQTIALCSISLFSISRTKGYIDNTVNEETALITLGLLFVLLLLYYCLRQLVYYSLCHVFFDRYKYKVWQTNYSAVTSIFGVLLYVPVLWIVFVGRYADIPIVLFIVLFVLSRLIIIYKITRIFHKKGDSLLYIILYLCAQEILPLVFLYEGLVYLYNFIETSTLWH